MSVIVILLATISAASFAFVKFSAIQMENFRRSGERLISDFARNTPAIGTLNLSQLSPEQFSTYSTLPSSFRFDADELAALRIFADNCQPTSRQSSKDLRKAWLYHRFMCKIDASLPDDFFARAPFMHPSGVSYVLAAWQTKRPEFDRDWLAENIAFAHVYELEKFPDAMEWREPMQTFRKINRVSARSIERGLTTIIDPALVLIMNSNSELGLTFRVFDRHVWDRFFRQHGVKGTIQYDKQICRPVIRDICWEPIDEAQTAKRIFQITITLSTLGLLAILVTILRRQNLNKERERQERETMVSILTHELRTPVATMKVSAESLRKDWESHSPETQSALLGILSSATKLQRVIKSSELYLRSGTSAIPSENDALGVRLDEVVAEISGSYAGRIAFNEPKEEITIKGNPHWIELCIVNLLDNALSHGKPPITVTVNREGKIASLTVQDTGTVKHEISKLSRQPFIKSNTSSGMGLGLFVVRKLMQSMSGDLKILNNPTRATLVWCIHEK